MVVHIIYMYILRRYINSHQLLMFIDRPQYMLRKEKKRKKKRETIRTRPIARYCSSTRVSSRMSVAWLRR